MINRNFWRRSIAYAFDLLICGFFATAIAILLNTVLSANVLAPALIKSGSCEMRDDLFTAELMNELLPLEVGQNHQQILCRHTNMLFTSFYTTTLRKSWRRGNANYSVHIAFYSDENGEQVGYISSEPFLYLLAPLVLALFLVRQGQTPGKRLLGLRVYNDAFDAPDLKSALMREYLKAAILVIGALLGFYTMLETINFDIVEAAEVVQELSAELEQTNFLTWATVVEAVAAAALLWFQFGSFIRWRGRTYWDQFAKLNTSSIDEFNLNKNLKNEKAAHLESASFK